jgi:hypothetical protein
VRTKTFPPCRTAAMTPAAAAVVVLPTPPGPQAITISLAAKSPSIDPDLASPPDGPPSRRGSGRTRGATDAFAAGEDFAAAFLAEAALVGPAFFAPADFVEADLADADFVEADLVDADLVAAFFVAAFFGAAADDGAGVLAGCVATGGVVVAGCVATGGVVAAGGPSPSRPSVSPSSSIRSPAPRRARPTPAWWFASHGIG